MAKFLTKSASQSTITKRKKIGSMTVTHTKYKGFEIARNSRTGETGKRIIIYVADNPHFPGIKFYDKTSHGIQSQITKFLNSRKVRNTFNRWLGKKRK